MTELEVLSTAGGSLLALLISLAALALSRGWVEGSVSLRVVPPRKRKPEAAETAETVPLREAS